MLVFKTKEKFFSKRSKIVERLNDILVNLLKTDRRYFTDEGELLKNAVYEDAMKMDSSLIKFFQKLYIGFISVSGI